MKTAEIMKRITKEQAREFMAKFSYEYEDTDLKQSVIMGLNYIGITVQTMTNGTANAVVTRMEKKAGPMEQQQKRKRAIDSEPSLDQIVDHAFGQNFRLILGGRA